MNYRYSSHSNHPTPVTGSSSPTPPGTPGTARPVRRQTSFASDDSGPTASTASYRRRREETLALKARNAAALRPPLKAPSSSRQPAQRPATSGPSGSGPAPPSSAVRRQKSTPAFESVLGATTPPPSPRPSLRRLPTVEPGTVASMNPEPAVALPKSAFVFEAAAYMSAKYQDAILVVHKDSGHLAGILTDKDLAYRVVANNLDARTTSVAQAMTANPISVTTSSSSHEALTKMISGQFRHLPVVESDDDSDDDEDVSGELLVHRGSAVGTTGTLPTGQRTSGGVVGILDITKCLYAALDKLERAHEEAHSEPDWDDEPAAAAARTHHRESETLRNQLASPDLAGLLATSTSSSATSPPMVSVRASVVEAARAMRSSHETAVLVFEADESGLGTLAGIFTSKDLVLRVLAAGLDPAATPVARVMTPHPDCVTPQTRVVDALRKMHVGRYLHLPVIDASGCIEGMVDVLKLTYTTLTKMTTAVQMEGPVWNRFWDDRLAPGDEYDDPVDPISPTDLADARQRDDRGDSDEAEEDDDDED
ncbi:hypothetical protein HKX48_002828, partial [Thoreauomyces humboldtii]